MSPRPSRRLGAPVLATLLGAGAWLGGCSESGGPRDPALVSQGSDSAIVSDPVPTPAPSGAHASFSVVGSVSTDLAYVSLPPGTIPDGATATIRNPLRAGLVRTAVIAGGFDAVPIAASAGDILEIDIRTAAGGLVSLMRAVPISRRPVVVRTDPPPGKRDQPLNASLVIAFSEPVDSATLTGSSVQLFRGTSAIQGRLDLLPGNGAIAAFTPTTPLQPNTDYHLTVTTLVRDLEGDALQADVTVAFTTGVSSTGPPASVQVSPDTVFLTGATYQLTATVRDRAGNLLTGHPVSWSSSNPGGLTVSQTGLLTALAAGAYFVTASVDSLQAYADVFVGAGPPASVSVAPTTASVGAAGDTIVLTAIVRDAAGRLLDHPTTTWVSSDTSVATVASDSAGDLGLALGTVTGVIPGAATITATSGTASGAASVTVTQPPSVASVTVSPTSATLVSQATKQLFATVRDPSGKVLAGRSIAWVSDNPAVATVSTSGVVTAVGAGSASVTATSGGMSGSSAISVTLLSLASVLSGGEHVCGLTANGEAYCWGYNGGGHLGNGTADDHSLWPVHVVGGLRFSSLSVGWNHNCALTATGDAYCWGDNNFGELGNGSTTASTVPVAVSGGLKFVTVSVKGYHTCALTATGAAHCWGNNDYGQLGDGSTRASPVPVAVAGGVAFAALSVGAWDTCALTAAGKAYCWGYNEGSVLGDGTSTNRPTPIAVSGGLTFSMIGAGGFETCGVTSGAVGYCWGSRSTTGSSVPAVLPGALPFATVTPGGQHTCGLTTAGHAYCWGDGSYGGLGNGTEGFSATPVAVVGGLTFGSVTPGGDWFACGLTTSGTAYCWGFNRYGQLGDGSTNNSSVPVKVAGQP